MPPRLGYTAWKNGRQDESHIGFKGYGLSAGPDDYYFTVHASTSEVRRIRERFHTITVAATDRATGETVADLSCKGDFGTSWAPRCLVGDGMVERPALLVGCEGVGCRPCRAVCCLSCPDPRQMTDNNF